MRMLKQIVTEQDLPIFYRKDSLPVFKKDLLRRAFIETQCPYEFMVDFEVIELESWHIQELADKYSSDNGTYFLCGKQYEYNELCETIRNNCYRLKINFIYKVNEEKMDG